MRYNPETRDYCDWGDKDDSGAHGPVVELSRCVQDDRLCATLRLAVHGQSAHVIVERSAFGTPWRVTRTIGVDADHPDLSTFVRSFSL